MKGADQVFLHWELLFVVPAVLVCMVVCADVVRAVEAPAVDLRSIISRADLHYDRPAERSEEGMPVGNGRMGSLVWTTPNALRFQINRVDVFAVNGATQSFPRAHSDYASGCAYMDIHVDDFGPEVFAGEAFGQHLAVYEGLMTARGKGVTARVLAWHERDVMAVEVEDDRDEPAVIHVDLRMLRYASQHVRGTHNDWNRRREAVVQTNAHLAVMRLEIREGRIVLVQEFREGEHYNASAVVVWVVGRESKAVYYNQSTVRLSLAPGAGRFTVLIGSASSFDQAEDVAAAAIAQVEAAEGVHKAPSPGTPGEGGGEGPDRLLSRALTQPSPRVLGEGFARGESGGDDVASVFEGLLASNRAWWAEFWSRGHVALHSADGEADLIEQNYHYFLYVMASSSRGDYPPRFGGMIWYTNGDLRAWGSQYWWANQSCYYNGLAPANRFELMDPMFAMHTRMYEACARAARQHWGSEGIWIPETVWFDGLAELPEEIAEEMRELYLLRKPWSERSAAFRRYAETAQSFSSRWNWISQDGQWDLGRWERQDKGAPPFGHVTHIFGTTAKVAWLYWQRYEYTMDEQWLRDRAYPMLRGAVEFYRNFPNLRKEADGKYHIHHTNSNEPAWGVRDSDEDLSAMRGVLPALIRASEILEVDAEMRPVWREFLENLAPLPTSDHPDALVPEGYEGPRVWVKGLRPAAKAGGMLPDRNTLPVWNFELCPLDGSDSEMWALANATFDAYFRSGIGPDTRVGTLSRLPIAAAALGRAEAVRYLIPNQIRASDADRLDESGVMRNRMALREGPGATECERLGRAAEALHMALLQSVPGELGESPIMRVFPAWPGDWDAQFTLLSRGGFFVTASMRSGRVEFVEVLSQAGGECRLRNPWPERSLMMYRDGELAGELAGAVVGFATERGERVMIVSRRSH